FLHLVDELRRRGRESRAQGVVGDFDFGQIATRADDVRVRGNVHVPNTSPPSTESTVPLMNRAASDASQTYALATSAGSPSFASGVRANIEPSAFSGMAFTISVAMNPGATALTRMPKRPSSRAHVCVKLITPAFVAA